MQPHSPSAKQGCRVCKADALVERVDFGPQPVCNHYLASAASEEHLFPRVLYQCTECGLTQLGPSPGMAELRSPYDWIRYGEPEGHLDDLLEKTIRLTQPGPDSVIYGLSYKDASLLDRFRKHGFNRTVLLDIKGDLGEASTCAGVETIQELFDEKRALFLAQKYGSAHLVIVRHVMEHVQDLHRFGRAIRTLLAPGGFLLVEQPDFTLPLALPDYTTVWEERTAFYTPTTLRRSLMLLGFEEPEIFIYPYPLEHALVGITRSAKAGANTAANPESLAVELQNGARHAGLYAGTKKQIRAHLYTFREQGRNVALFGAGHMACNFINLHGLQDLVSFVVDDHPKKCGLFMPGSHLPIVGSYRLLEEKAGLCLLTVRPEIEQAVMNSNPQFIKNGGRFASILPGGPMSLQIHPV